MAAATLVAVVAAAPHRADAVDRYQSERCTWLAPHLEAVGLPVATFLRIAWSESGCARQPRCHVDRDDASCSRWGINHRTAGLRRTWARWCGAPTMYSTRDLDTDLRCVKAAFDRMGLAPWR